MPAPYQFLVETYDSERLKTLGVWSMFADGDLWVRPHPTDPRGRSFLEQMVHQCAGEDLWFRNLLGIDVGAPPLPEDETRIGFLRRYAEDSGRRVRALRERPDDWWPGEVAFFEVVRSRAWILTRRIAHSAHHRGQLTCLLRTRGRDLHSTYGPTADTGGLPANRAPTVYAYPDVDTLVEAEAGGGSKAPLPDGAGPVTERPHRRD